MEVKALFNRQCSRHAVYRVILEYRWDAMKINRQKIKILDNK